MQRYFSAWRNRLGILLALGLSLSATAGQAMTLPSAVLQALNDEDYAGVLPRLQALAERMPDAADVHYHLARAYWGDGQLKAAEQAVETLLELRRDHAADHYLAGRIYAERLQSVGVFKKLSYARKLRKAFSNSMELDPSFVKARLAMVRFHLAAPGIVGGSREEAEAIVASLHKIDVVEGLRAQALVALEDEDLDGAIALMQQVLEHRPDDVNALYMLALTLINREDFACAVPLLHRALAVPRSQDMDIRQQQRGSLYQMGKVAGLSGQWLDEGRQALETYVQLPRFNNLPPRAWAYFRLGQIHDHLAQRDKAQEYFMLARQEDLDDDELDDLLKAQEKKYRLG